MANHSLDDSFITLNLSFSQYDTLIESVAKANALTQVILSVGDLEELSTPTLHNFLWLLDELISRIGKICDDFKALQPIANT